MSTIQKYGLQHTDTNLSDEERFLALEMEAIRRGGKWKNSIGHEQGMGLPHHFKEACKIIWPHIDWHRWVELCNAEIRRPKAKVTVMMGAGSTGKTGNAAWQYLLEYYCRPDETLVMISSTDLRGLELRVWGEIKKLHELAKQKFPWLPGRLIDSRHAITTDTMKEGAFDVYVKMRDLRKGVIGIPTVEGSKAVGLSKWCFPAGQMVDTPFGPRPIESMEVGDAVISATGESRVIATANHIATQIVRVRLCDGRSLDCTPNHKLLTDMGWLNAIDISTGQLVFSSHETIQAMRHMPATIAKGEVQVLLAGVPKEILGEEMQGMRCDIHSKRAACGFLRSVLLWDLENEAAGNCFEDDFQQGLRCNRPIYKRGHKGESSRNGAEEEVCREVFVEEPPSKETVHPKHTNKRGTNRTVGISRRGSQLQGGDRNVIEAWPTTRLSPGRFVSGHKAERGAGWEGTLDIREQAEESCAGQVPFGTRVDSVEILEPSGDPRHSESEGGYRVYDLQVEGHPSFSVNGVIVHNCGVKQKHLRLIADECTAMNATFLSAFSNLNNNEDFQALVLGNPDDILDPLGIAAEPVDGWSSHMEPTKTSVWDTKFFNGRCINLVGIDSPNFDFPERDEDFPRYPYLISQKKITETIAGFGKDTFEYYSQCVGVMKIAQMSRRVITRDLCRQFRASDVAVWDGSGTTKIAALDAAYGGDRCVGGYAEYGKCFDGKIRLQFFPPHIVPVKVKTDEPMAEEDSISDFERTYCESKGVDPENFFHDSTGRGSLGTSLSRKWSSACNPVEFGGVPTKRPVSMDTFTSDKVTGEHRLKRCDEHYVKFVTEMWYSLRYAIEADQIRGLPEEVINELCTRNWERVANDKIQIESKLELKKRIRKSCDLGDWAAIILEGARRKGFQIAKLSPPEGIEDDGYEADNQRLDELINEELLAHS